MIEQRSGSEKIVRTWFAVGVATVGLLGATACGGSDDDSSGSDAAAPTVARPTSASTRPTGSNAVALSLAKPARQRVPARANIFGAGFNVAPDPGDGGGGVLPPAWRLPAGARVVTFPRVTGRVSPVEWQDAWNGPRGDGEGPTDVETYRGISGIVDRRNGMFVVGVFLGDGAPASAAPPRLDFTDREDFRLLAPRVGQTFFVGDGRGRRYRVPAGATRVFVGFADGYLYQGPPGWYGNNAGSVIVSVKATRG